MTALTALSATTTFAYAQLNNEEYSGQSILAQDETAECGPFSIGSYADWTGKADFQHRHCKRKLDTVQYGEAEADANMVFYYDRCNKEGLVASASYTFTQIKWENPYFNQSDFNTASVAVSGFTERAQDWRWAGQVKINFDNLEHFKFADYITFDLLLSGRYAYSECFGLHWGVLALTGYRIDRIYPILGFDWQISEDFKLNMVYPLNISLAYSITKEWTALIAGRAFDSRHRVGADQPVSRGLVEYRAAGVEAQIAYESSNKRIEGDIHAGQILGGTVKASNKSHHHIKRYPFDTAPYVGGHIAIKF